MTKPLTDNKAVCIVGSYCGAPEPEALHVLECDTETGAIRLVQSVKGVEGTSYFQIDDAGKYLYSITGDERKRDTKGKAVRFALEGDRIGAMEELAELPCPAPCHVALSPDGKLFSFAAYRAGTAGTLPVDGGKVASYVFPDDAMGPNAKRQEKAFAHQTFYMPDGRLGAVDLGCDRIRFFDPGTMTPCGAADLKSDPGDGPRHALLSRDKRFLFVLNELSSTVTTYSLGGEDGATIVRTGKQTMLPEGFNRWEADGETLATKASAIRLSADGKTLMASNRGYDSIAFYGVDGQTGALTLRNIAKLRGRSPRDFALMPGEKFLVAGHELDDEIQCYRIDWETCGLEPIGDPIPAWHPVCVAFLSPLG